MRPTIAAHIFSPFSAMLVMREKPCAAQALCISIAYVITTVIIFKFNSISDSPDDSRMPTLSFFEDLLLFLTNSFLLLVSLKATRLSSPETSATAS